jgi:glycosyltransferase involved in cell wall biosynthesis
MGSEPGVGWNMVVEIAKHHNTWVITRKDNQPYIQKQLATQPVRNLNFIYCDLPGEQYWKQGLQAVHFHYYFWQIAAYIKAKALHKKVKFDIAHHITYVRYSTPSFLVLLPVPFVWGPVGGGESAPSAFCQDFDRYGKTYELLRQITRWIGEHDPFVALTARRSLLAYATTEETASRLRNLGAKKVQIQSQVGISADEIRQLNSLETKKTTFIRFISVGRLLHWKGFHLGLRAFAKSGMAAMGEYWIIGEGREKKRLQKLSEELGISESVNFFGNLPRNEVLETLSQCHVLVHPSLHESGGFVCMEAMAAGRPVICLDLGGPAIQVTEQTGYKIAAENPVQVVDDLAEAMFSLGKEPNLLNTMSSASKRHVANTYAWSIKGQQLSQQYFEIFDEYYNPGTVTNQPVC